MVSLWREEDLAAGPAVPLPWRLEQTPHSVGLAFGLWMPPTSQGSLRAGGGLLGSPEPQAGLPVHSLGVYLSRQELRSGRPARPTDLVLMLESLLFGPPMWPQVHFWRRKETATQVFCLLRLLSRPSRASPSEGLIPCVRVFGFSTKERERERERENRQRERERERERDRERERRQRERERERERERDKERQRRKEEWERERAKRDEKDRLHRDRDKEREKDKEKPKARSPQPPR